MFIDIHWLKRLEEKCFNEKKKKKSIQENKMVVVEKMIS